MSDSLVLVAAINTVGIIVVAFMQRQQGKKIDETHTQVTVNSYSQDQPTVLDQLDDIKRGVGELKDDVAEVKAAHDSHIRWHLSNR